VICHQATAEKTSLARVKSSPRRPRDMSSGHGGGDVARAARGASVCALECKCVRQGETTMMMVVPSSSRHIAACITMMHDGDARPSEARRGHCADPPPSPFLARASGIAYITMALHCSPMRIAYITMALHCSPMRIAYITMALHCTPTYCMICVVRPLSSTSGVALTTACMSK